MSDPKPPDLYLDKLRRLNVNKSGERRAPHKPLLLLIAISRLLEGRRALPFGEVEALLDPLLASYAPPVKTSHQPELPYWHLQSSGLWEVPGSEDFPRQRGGFPTMAALRSSTGHLDEGFANLLVADPGFRAEVITILLDDHFPESLHEDILEAVGLEMPILLDEDHKGKVRRQRDPNFRLTILRAYEHRCAVTGFRVALAGHYFGCEAAHVKWHAYDGPDTLDNGFAVEPTLHKLFDAGAWTLSDDRRIIVSAELTGEEAAILKLRTLHGKPLGKPLPGQAELTIEHIRWHREPDLGGVFRHPAL